MHAVLLLSSAVGGPDPTTRLAGLSLSLRAALTLQQAGAEALTVVSDRRPDWFEDPRLTIPHTRVADLAGVSGQPLYLVARHDVVAASAVYRALLAVDRPAAACATGPFVADATQLGADASSFDSIDVPGWIADASTPAGRRAAVRLLFEDCRKPVDGFVSRYLNRYVSLFISRQLVDLPISPNAMTGFTFAISLVAGGFAVQGDYVNTVVAACLMQCNSILDGVDGELARVRFQGSKLGQWLDTVGDDVSNVVFWTTLGFGALTVPTYGRWLAYCGWFAAVANGVAALAYYRQLTMIGSGDLNQVQDASGPAQGPVAMFVKFVSLLLKQDFFLFLMMVLALIGVLHQAMPVIALAALITMGNALVGLLRRQFANSR